MKKILIGFLVICCLGAMASGEDSKSEKTIAQEDAGEAAVKQFVIDNPGYFEMDGSTEEIEHMQQSKDWADGQRYIVFMKGNVKGEYWTLYIKDNVVVGLLYGEGETEKRLM